MKTNILSEQIKYSDGNRITTQSIEIISTLADDMATVANYHGTLAALQSQLEQIQAAAFDSSRKPIFDGEIARIKSEMQTIQGAIEIQNRHIKGFEENAL